VPTFGGVLAALGTVALVAFAVMSLAIHISIPVPLWVAAIVSAIAGLQTIVMGVVAVYLSKVLDEVRARPTYIVSDRIGLPFARDGRSNSFHEKSDCDPTRGPRGIAFEGR